jgi:flagellar biosynthesis protein FlhG
MSTDLKSTDHVRPGSSARAHAPLRPFVADRAWILGLPPHVQVPEGPIPRLLAVGGGKGGVGKSILSANLASKLAQSGYRVLVVDLDLGCANLHTHFGIPKPKFTLANFILFGDRSFAEMITPTTVAGVALIAGGQEAAWGRHLARGPETLMALWDSLLRSQQQFNVDFVIMDLGAGTQRHTMDFFSAASLGIATVLPEPTSIENAYVFLKTHLWHLVDHVAIRTQQQDAASDLRLLLTKIGSDGSGKGYLDAFRQLAQGYPTYINDVLAAMRSRNLGIVINQTRSQADIEIGGSMELICRRYFGLQAFFLGDMNYDDCAWKSLRNRRLLLNDFPHSVLSRRLARVTQSVIDLVSR